MMLTADNDNLRKERLCFQKLQWKGRVSTSKVQGPVSFLISLDDGRVVCRHVDHVKSRETMPEQSPGPVDPETVNNEEANTEVERQRPVRIHNPPSRLID